MAKSNGDGTMPNEFVHTGQTLTEDGAAFCPVERKERGLAAVGASIGILLLGAGFLAYSMVSAPVPAAPSIDATNQALAANDPVSDAAGGQKVKIKIAQPEDASPGASAAGEVDTGAGMIAQTQRAAIDRTGFDAVSKDDIDAALKAAREARAAGENDALRDDGGLTPRLKPTAIARATVAKAIKQDGDMTPSLKPTAIETARDPIKTAAPAAKIRPIKMGGVFLASTEDAPPPFFFAEDIDRKILRNDPTPVQFAADIDRDLTETKIRVSRGENFVDALKRAGIAAADRNAAAAAFAKHYNLRRLQPGQEFSLTLGWPNQTLYQIADRDAEPEARLIGFEFKVDAENRIHMRRDENGRLTARKDAIPLTTRFMSIAGRIAGSLYLSAKAQGATDKVVADLANTFAYDVDFQREIFGGDEFEAIYEAKFDEEGNVVSSGEILFARLHWRGRSQEKSYYRFETNGRADFFDATGQSAKRLLMKTPIDGARLSSRFGTRKHPILGYRRAHKGVDFAAPRGTPIKAAGDGVIERADRYGSFGNYIRIRHANGYKTAYAHLKGFRRGIRKGKRVRQGDIIGYVGTTGRSTGPHLHYEVHLKGKAVNPQKLKIATGKKLKGAELDRFQIQRELIDAMRAPESEAASLYAEDTDAEKSAL